MSCLAWVRVRPVPLVASCVDGTSASPRWYSWDYWGVPSRASTGLPAAVAPAVMLRWGWQGACCLTRWTPGCYRSAVCRPVVGCGWGMLEGCWSRFLIYWRGERRRYSETCLTTCKHCRKTTYLYIHACQPVTAILGISQGKTRIQSVLYTFRKE